MFRKIKKGKKKKAHDAGCSRKALLQLWAESSGSRQRDVRHTVGGTPGAVAITSVARSLGQT